MTTTMIRALAREAVGHTPVWMMRQAGRYLPEYRALKDRHGFLGLLRTPELACEVTLQPVRRLGVDAAILFSDILTPAIAMGIDVTFDPGPIVATPLGDRGAIQRLEPERVTEGAQFVFTTLGMAARELAGQDVALVGFAGAPFTLSAYLVEGGAGGHSKDFESFRAWMRREPALYAELAARLTRATVIYLTGQASAGAQVLQLFDTWAGLLDVETYRRQVFPYVQEIAAAVRHAAPQVPLIYFIPQAAHLLTELRELPVQAFSVDWRQPLSVVRGRLGRGYALQGNLDPTVLLAGDAAIDAGVAQVLADWGDEAGHVMNLGHGVSRHTPVEAAFRFVETTHRLSARPVIAVAGAAARATP